MRPSRGILLCGLLAALHGLTYGCAGGNERQSSMSRSERSRASAPDSRASVQPNRNESPVSRTMSLDEPVARPAELAEQLNTHVRYAIRPMGHITYDGQVLPQNSPDGRFLAVQSGEAPHWETLLDADSVVIPASTRIDVYDMTQQAARKVPVREAIPVGAVLGHCCDDQYFAIELPQADGSRWAGRARWIDGQVEWVVRDPGKSASSLTWRDDGMFVYLLRDVGERERSVIVERGGARQLVLSIRDNVLFLRRATGGGEFLGFVESEAGIEIVRWRVQGLDGNIESTARFRIASGHDPFLAYQSLIALNGSPAVLSVAASESGQNGDELTLFFHPAAGRMMAHSKATGQILPLLDQSIAGCWVNDTQWPGVMITTPDGLKFQALQTTAAGMLSFSEGVRVLAEPYVPKACSRIERPYLLIGPGAKSSRDEANRRLSVSFLSLSPGPEE